MCLLFGLACTGDGAASSAKVVEICVFPRQGEVGFGQRRRQVLDREDVAQQVFQARGSRGFWGEGRAADELAGDGALLLVPEVSEFGVGGEIEQVGIGRGAVLGGGFIGVVAGGFAILPLPDVDEFVGKEHGREDVGYLGVGLHVIAGIDVGVDVDGVE